jgi:hypothetical protein
MKRTTNSKLALERQTIRVLVPSMLRRAVGGTQGYTGANFQGDGYEGDDPPIPPESGNSGAAISRNIC